ncbi:MAG: CopD family protein [Ferruginibacter sp.]
MIYAYIKALHIIFIVTWFSGMFYLPRLFIYATEANEKPEPDRSILIKQFALMSRRLWYGITWPSALLTIIFGGWMAWLYGFMAEWLWIKLAFVAGLYAYHFTLHHIFQQEQKNIFRYTSQQLRLWNEVATIFLVAIVMLASVKQGISVIWGLAGLVSFIVFLMLTINLYKKLRQKNQ